MHPKKLDLTKIPTPPKDEDVALPEMPRLEDFRPLKKEFKEGPDKEYQMFCEDLAPSLVPDGSVSSAGPSLSDTGESVEPEAKQYTDPSKTFNTQVAQHFKQCQTVQSPPLKKVSDLLDSNFIVGEMVSHANGSPKKFLIENMKELKKAGFETLFMEFLYYDHQADLDLFHKTGKMPERLKSRLEEQNRGHGWNREKQPDWSTINFTALVVAAQKAGIRIVGIETEKIFKTQDRYDSYHLKDNRIANMNYSAHQIMQREAAKLPQGKKWCAMMGSAHLIANKDVPGVHELMGARTVMVSLVEGKEPLDSKKSAPFSEVASNVELPIGENRWNPVDLYIKRDYRLPMNLQSITTACKLNEKHVKKQHAEVYYLLANDAKLSHDEVAYKKLLKKAAKSAHYEITPKACHELSLFYKDRGKMEKFAKWNQRAIDTGYQEKDEKAEVTAPRKKP